MPAKTPVGSKNTALIECVQVPRKASGPHSREFQPPRPRKDVAGQPAVIPADAP